MSRQRHLHPPEVVKLAERAQRNAGSAPRKHHLVPASYLRRWEEDGQLRVTEVDAKRTFTTAAAKAARETDFYRIESDDLNPDEFPPLLFETLLSKVEGWGKAVIDKLVEDPPAITLEERVHMCWYLAFQLTRGRSFRREQSYLANETFKLQYAGLSEEGIARQLARGGEEPTPERVRESRRMFDDLQAGKRSVQPQTATMIGSAAEAAAAVGEHFVPRTWVVCHTPAMLITSDEPVVLVGGPESPRGQRAGVATADVVLFPLAPDRLLVLMHEDLAQAHTRYRHLGPHIGSDVLNNVECVEVCHEVLASAHGWAFEKPSRHLTSRLGVPKRSAAANLEEVGPIREGRKSGMLLRFYAQNRWAQSAAPPPWPVQRWWRAT